MFYLLCSIFYVQCFLDEGPVKIGVEAVTEGAEVMG